jgi:hypothetical protein
LQEGLTRILSVEAAPYADSNFDSMIGRMNPPRAFPLKIMPLAKPRFSRNHSGRNLLRESAHGLKLAGNHVTDENTGKNIIDDPMVQSTP